MLEPIQGENGIAVPGEGYLRAIRDLCDRRDLLLIFDEVQTGIGRTGTLYAYQQTGVAPDVMTLAKGLGGGVPIGAMLATERLAPTFGPGAHGSTFGGNALACAVALAVLDTLKSEGVLANCVAMGERLRAGLEGLRDRFPSITDVRGRGLLIGAELTEPGAPVVERCLAAGLILNCTANRVLRLTPPLTVRAEEVDRALGILEQALAA
jgi:acetylornithine aminotransferase